MKKDFIVIVPQNIFKTSLGIDFYDKIKVIECQAEDEKEIYSLFPDAIKIHGKKNYENFNN